MAIRKRGTYLWVVGPDGCGKSTLATAVAKERGALHRYWRPAILPMPKELVGRHEPAGPNVAPHSHGVNGLVKAVLRTSYYALDYVLGYLFVFRPALRSGRDVIVERGWLDMVVDPLRYRLPSPELAKRLTSAVRLPDVIVVVVVSPGSAIERKPELAVAEIERQYGAWFDLVLPVRVNRVAVSNEGDVDLAVTKILDLLPGRPCE